MHHRGLFDPRARRAYGDEYRDSTRLTGSLAACAALLAGVMAVHGEPGLAALFAGVALVLGFVMAWHYVRFAARYWQGRWWELWKEVEWYRAVYGEIDDVNRWFYSIRPDGGPEVFGEGYREGETVDEHV